MKFSQILKYFIPKEKKFFSLFNLVAENIVAGSEELRKLFNADTVDDRKSIGLIIKSIERKGDDYTSDIFDELNRTFITPFDREDIHELTSALDDVLDLMYGLSGKIDLYHVTTISTYMKEMVALTHEGCIQLQMAVNGLEHMNKHSDKVLKSCKELNKIESRVDGFHRSAISSLFENEKDPIELIKQKEIIQNIEKIANKIEDVSDIIKTILVKYA
jgi:predicted phosphate transport protein (TIGR00153 family)